MNQTSLILNPLLAFNKVRVLWKDSECLYFTPGLVRKGVAGSERRGPTASVIMNSRRRIRVQWPINDHCENQLKWNSLLYNGKPCENMFEFKNKIMVQDKQDNIT